MKIAFCFYLLLFATTISGHAQSAKSDTAFLRSSMNYAVNLYNQKLKGESPLHNGSQYSEYISLDEEHPFFLSDDWLEGSVIYQGDHYTNIPLQFDISADKVIAEHSTSGRKVQLINKKITEFTIGSHRFIQLENKPGDSLKIPPGFYELLMESPHLTLVAKRIKTLQKKVVANEATAEFEEVNRFYYLKDRVYYPVKGKKSALHVLADKKSSLKQQLKKNKIRFGSTREKGLLETAKLYTMIKNQE
jgi:hypothetical protein